MEQGGQVHCPIFRVVVFPTFYKWRVIVITVTLFSCCTFSQTSGLTSDNILADIRIFLNGNDVTPASTAKGGANTVVVTDGSGSDAGKYVLTFNTTFDFNAASSGTATDGDYIEYIDVDGNGEYTASDDILIKKATNVTNTEITNYETSVDVLDLNNVGNITVGTADITSTIVDVSAAENKVLKKQSVVIK